MSENDNIDLKPVFKWPGGKRRLAHDILPLIHVGGGTYVEPFVGGGAILLALRPKKAIINDSNAELINTYTCIRDHTDELLNALKMHESKNNADYFYSIRAKDRIPDFIANTPPVERAARILYLNKTCYNGLFRVNKAGQFNAAYGRYKHPIIVDEPAIRALAEYLSTNDVTITCGDYKKILNDIPQDSFVYLDPPYMPVSVSSSFTGYTPDKFNHENQIELKAYCDKLSARGIPFLESNSNATEVMGLYKAYNIINVRANRCINKIASKRGAVMETLISNYHSTDGKLTISCSYVDQGTHNTRITRS